MRPIPMLGQGRFHSPISAANSLEYFRKAASSRRAWAFHPSRDHSAFCTFSAHSAITASMVLATAAGLASTVLSPQGFDPVGVQIVASLGHIRLDHDPTPPHIIGDTSE